MPRQHSTIATRPCELCGTPFDVTSQHPDARFCGRSCAVRSARGVALPPPNPSGLCQCGCGATTPIARSSDSKRGTVAGEHVRYLPNHHRRLTTPPYLEVDTGFTTPCHMWQRAVGKVHGYGLIKVDGRSRLAHIVAWETVNGPVPDGLVLDHLCRIRSCMNPDHLEPVTVAVNNQRGASAKLSADDVAEIRRLAGTVPGTEIAEQFGISKGLVYHIVNGMAWRNT